MVIMKRLSGLSESSSDLVHEFLDVAFVFLAIDVAEMVGSLVPHTNGYGERDNGLFAVRLGVRCYERYGGGKEKKHIHLVCIK